ncbi:MAG: signal peptidase II [Helicobacter sp.]|nr:signal peptidase II [Helicobacter sp.]
MRFTIIFIGIFALDQIIKFYFLHICNGAEGCFTFRGDFFSLVLVYNKGVAFSLFAFLSHYLKYLQIILLVAIALVLRFPKNYFSKHPIILGLIFGSGSSNILDRFIHDGVVDYFYWHYGFKFAVFNLADVAINISIAIIIIKFLLDKKYMLQSRS